MNRKEANDSQVSANHHAGPPTIPDHTTLCHLEGTPFPILENDVKWYGITSGFCGKN